MSIRFVQVYSVEAIRTKFEQEGKEWLDRQKGLLIRADELDEMSKFIEENKLFGYFNHDPCTLELEEITRAVPKTEQ